MKLLARLLQVRTRQAGAAWVQGDSQGRLGGLCLQTQLLQAVSPLPPPSSSLLPSPPDRLSLSTHHLPGPQASLLCPQYPAPASTPDQLLTQLSRTGVSRAPLTVLGRDTGCGTQGRDSGCSTGHGTKVRGQGHDERQSQSQASLRHRILSQVHDPQARWPHHTG